jgi:hypothetical protein
MDRTRRTKGDVCIVCVKTAYSETSADCERWKINKLPIINTPALLDSPRLQNILYNQQLMIVYDRHNRTFRESVEPLTYEGLDMHLL